MGGLALLLQAFILCCAHAGSFAEEAAQTQVVTLVQGPVRGYRGTDGGYFAFYGIPYAIAPTGRDRFKAPLPAPIWSETLEAVDKNIACPQLSFFQSTSQKDQCLIANVYVADTEETNLPVVVFVHGGSYLEGSGNSYTPTELVTRGKVVAVNFNYRLGVHGFLCLGTENVPGNAGMKDMVALLRWVKANIAQFGGNPDDITIEGYSAGSTSVDLLTFSKTTDGLFNRVIQESGAAISAWAVQIQPLESAKRFAALFNFTSDNVYELEEFYLTKPLDQLISAEVLNSPDSTLPFVPCVEIDTGSEMFLDDAPINILKKDSYIRRPFLAGFTEMEGRIRLQSFTEWIDLMNNNFSEFLPADLHFAKEEDREVVAERVKQFYFGTKNVSVDTLQEYVDYQTDTLFSYPALRSLSLQVQAGNQAMFLYKYSFYDESINDRRADGIDVFGAGHCAQTKALFDQKNNWNESTEYQQMRTLIRELWINFIRTGRPIPEGSTLVEGSWPAAGVTRAPYMSLDMPSRLQPGTPWADRARLWDEIYEKHYRAPAPPPPPPARDIWMFTEP